MPLNQFQKNTGGMFPAFHRCSERRNGLQDIDSHGNSLTRSPVIAGRHNNGEVGSEGESCKCSWEHPSVVRSATSVKSDLRNKGSHSAANEKQGTSGQVTRRRSIKPQQLPPQKPVKTPPDPVPATEMSESEPIMLPYNSMYYPYGSSYAGIHVSQYAPLVWCPEDQSNDEQ